MAQTKTTTGNVDTVCHQIVTSVAEEEGVDPLELTPPLYDVIDPSALEQLFASTPTAGRKDGQVIFSYNGCEVTVSGDGSVTVQ